MSSLNQKEFLFSNKMIGLGAFWQLECIFGVSPDFGSVSLISIVEGDRVLCIINVALNIEFIDITKSWKRFV